MHLLRLLRGRDFARSNRPNGFVGDDDFGPIFDLRGNGCQLLGYDGDGLVGVALGEGFAAAEDYGEAAGERGGGFVGDELEGKGRVSRSVH